MNNFKVGDRVEVIAAESTGGHYKNGDVFTIAKVDDDDGDMDMVEMTGMFLHPREVRLHTRTPDVITINRADLPEVTASKDHLIAGKNTFGRFLDADGHRKMALSQLAVAEYMERERDAENEAKSKLDKRRDELAKEVAKRACYVNYQNFTYEDHAPATQSVINMLIELEPDHA